MIDINELRRLAQAATPGPWHATKSVETNSWAVWSDTTRLMELRPTKTVDMYRVSNTAAFIAAVNPAAISEILDRLEAAEKERDWHADRCEDAMNECDALRAAVRHEADCVEAAKAEIDALRAKIERADRLEKVESALSDLLNDLEERAKWNLEASQRVVACGNGVYVRAKAALEESK